MVGLCQLLGVSDDSPTGHIEEKINGAVGCHQGAEQMTMFAISGSSESYKVKLVGRVLELATGCVLGRCEDFLFQQPRSQKVKQYEGTQVERYHEHPGAGPGPEESA